MLAIDHVIILVDDLGGAAAWMRREHGLASAVGGRHDGHGTGNRIVPLGADYLELMAVVDRDEAGASPLGRWALANTRDRPSPAALCLRTDDAASVAARLGLEAYPMSRTRPDGTTLAWRLVGLEGMLGPSRLPFFIEWDDPSSHPGSTEAAHEHETFGISTVELGGDADLLASHLGNHDLPLIVIDAAPGVSAVTVSTGAGDIVIRTPPPG